jgi:hypothetical protein
MHIFFTLILGALLLALMVALLVRDLFFFTALLRPAGRGCLRLALAVIVGLLALSPHLALAATGAPTQSIALSDIWQITLSLACAAFAAGVPILISLANKHLKLTAGSQAANDLDQALEHGAALVLDFLKSLAAHNQALTLPSGALASAAALVAKLAPAAIAELGITPDEIASLITARVGARTNAPANSGAVPAPAPTSHGTAPAAPAA